MPVEEEGGREGKGSGVVMLIWDKFAMFANGRRRVMEGHAVYEEDTEENG